MNCDRCGRPAMTFIRYNGSHLCDRHLMSYVERRVKREVRKQVDLSRGKVIAVALSGGKDSMACLHLMRDILSPRPDVRLVALSVDEGIDGYRSECIRGAGSLCDELGIEHRIGSFHEEYGLVMDSVVKVVERSPCTYCGVLRRRLLNRMAKDAGATYLATGLNLDDTAQSIMMNFVRGDVDRLARLGPHERVRDGLVPRVQPLRSIPEKETWLYATAAGLRFHDSSCPYAGEAMRNEFRSMVYRLEEGTPGARFSILASYDKLRPMLGSLPSKDLGRCACGEPTLGDRCMACTMLDELRGRGL